MASGSVVPEAVEKETSARFCYGAALAQTHPQVS